MRIEANTPDEYLDALPEDRRAAVSRLRQTISDSLPDGFLETMSYGMIGYVVPLATYPNGYLNNPKEPLPFIAIASQKNFVAVYHMGLYADKLLLDWFAGEYPKYCKGKPDMGKSCIRFKKLDQIPYDLIGELAAKISPQQWIEQYKKLRP